MGNSDKQIEVRLDGYTRVCLGVIAVLLTVLIVGLWADFMPSGSSARAAEPFLNSAAQREAMVSVQEATNVKLDELIGLLKNGSAKVQIVGEAPSATGGGNAATKSNK